MPWVCAGVGLIVVSSFFLPVQYTKNMPWVCAGVGLIVAVVIIVADYALAKNPVITVSFKLVTSITYLFSVILDKLV